MRDKIQNGDIRKGLEFVNVKEKMKKNRVDDLSICKDPSINKLVRNIDDKGSEEDRR